MVLVDPLEMNSAASSWDKAQELMADSVNMQNAGYLKLAGGIREAVQNWLIGRKRKANEEQGAAEKKPRLGGGEAARGWQRARRQRRRRKGEGARQRGRILTLIY